MKKRYSDYLDVSGNWQLLVDDNEDSWWDYKVDAIERILELLDLESENGLNSYDYDGESLNIKQLKVEIETLPEEDFYTILDDIKTFCDFSGDIKLYNISDEDEIDFLQEEGDEDYYDFD